MAGDSKIVIDWANRRGSLQVLALLHWMEQIEFLNASFTTIQLCHIVREQNALADKLSKRGSFALIGQILYELLENSSILSVGSLPN